MHLNRGLNASLSAHTTPAKCSVWQEKTVVSLCQPKQTQPDTWGKFWGLSFLSMGAEEAVLLHREKRSPASWGEERGPFSCITLGGGWGHGVGLTTGTPYRGVRRIWIVLIQPWSKTPGTIS